MITFKQKIFFVLYAVLANSTIFGATFPIVPEFQVYHTVGSRESTYTTGGLGLSLHLFNDSVGTGRYLQVLALSIPDRTVASKSKVGSMYLSQNASGFEIGVHDQWKNPEGKGATLSLRKIHWPKVHQGNNEPEEASSDILHMGWNWITGTPIVTVWLLGLDIASLHFSHDRKIEIQIALGMRTAF
ncbi:MAG: hypothetical protein CL935_05720 [Deltaproteobacteria bacterium]|nr:hypothetical protein [Deltaproteobacteria bacterium]